jgi:hypothetical protein
MSKRHQEILARLSPEAVRALINTHEGRAVAIPPGPMSEVVRRELLDAQPLPLARPINMAATAVQLTTVGEVVRHYAMIEALGNLG